MKKIYHTKKEIEKFNKPIESQDELKRAFIDIASKVKFKMNVSVKTLK